MKCSRYFVATHVIDGESRPVHFLQFSDGASWFAFERRFDCTRCENGVVRGCDSDFACDECDGHGTLAVDVPCDAIGNTEDSELYLAPITTRVDLKALQLISIGKAGVL